MKHSHYLAGVCGEAGNYGIVFPDFPGCVSAGDTVDMVIAMGREALQFHIDSMIEDGDAIPAPSPVDYVRLDAEFGGDADEEPEPWVAVVAIEVMLPDLPGTINVSLGSDLVREITSRPQDTPDALRGLNTRAFVEQAVRRELDRLKKSA